MTDGSTKPVIVLAFANDLEGKNYLHNLAEEARELQDVLEHAKAAGLCELVVRQNITIKDLIIVLQNSEYRNRIAVLHYGGHANSSHLLFETQEGGSDAAGAAGLAAFLGQRTGLELVFLNGCSTQEQAEGFLNAGVSAVIATSRSIDDDVARNFAKYFYNGLAGGASIGTAYREAQEATKLIHGDHPRDLYPVDCQADPIADRWPWDLYLREGASTTEDWNLPDAARNPLFGLPELPRLNLPDSPYRHLEWYRREDAEVFFGRGREIRDLYKNLTEPGTAPILLFFGQSGVGKSSLLAAGLLPRLEAGHQVIYVRRDQATGLLGTLQNVLGINPAESQVGVAIGTAWRDKETQAGRPLIVAFDQVEETFTRPNPSLPDELAVFMNALCKFMIDLNLRPKGKLLLGFRKEWLAEIEKLLEVHKLPRRRVFLEHLDRQGIIEVVTGPARIRRLYDQYGLTVEDDLPNLIANDLLADAGSAVAPTLQILLCKMWEQAVAIDNYRPCFNHALYAALRTEGLGLGDFLDRQLSMLHRGLTRMVDSGLALDLLAHHTTPLGTAEQRALAKLKETYRHQADTLASLLQSCQDLYLLVDPARNEAGAPAQSRLAHDTLAPHVRQRFASSDRPGQRARRILENRVVDWEKGRQGPPLDEADLKMVEAGLSGMRVLTGDEQRLLETSREAQAERECARRKTQACILASQAQLEVEQHLSPQRALLLAIESATVYTPALPVARGVLYMCLGTFGGEPLCGHEGAVIQVAFSPDGNWLATASEDHTARLWDLQVPQAEPIVLQGHIMRVTSVVFSPDGCWLATSSDDGNVQLWDAQNHRTEPVYLPGHGGEIKHVAFSPDSRWLAFCCYRYVRLWDMYNPSTQPVESFEHMAWVHHFVFSPDSRWLATGSDDHTARLWDMQYPRAGPIVLRGHEGAITRVTFSPNGRWLATGSRDNTSRLWDMQDRSAKPAVLRGHELEVTQVVFSPDNRWLATGSWDKTVRLWNVHDPSTEAATLRDHEDMVSHVTFSPDSRWLATGSDDSTIHLWDLQDYHAEPTVLRGHEAIVRHVVFSADGCWLATGSSDHTARLWDVHNPYTEPTVLCGHKESVRYVAFSPDGRYLATGGYDNFIRLWNMQDPCSEPVLLRGHEDLVNQVAFSPNGRWSVSCSNDSTAQLWNMQDLRSEPIVLRGHETGIAQVAFSPDSCWLATGSFDFTARLWNMQDPLSEPIALNDHKDWVTQVAFSPDGCWLATGSHDHTTCLWKMQDPRAGPIMLRGHNGVVTQVVFSPDRRWLATGSSDGIARLWDMRNPHSDPAVLCDHESEVTQVSFSPDGNWLATGSSDGIARLWDMRNPHIDPALLRDHKSAVTQVAFSPDSCWLATGSEDETARLWDTQHPNAEPAVLRGHEYAVTQVAFSPNGLWLATGSCDQTVRLWTLPVELLVAKARRIAGRNLSHSEWERYFPAEPYRKTCPVLPVHETVIEAIFNQGNRLAKEGCIVEALGRLEQAIELDPGDDINITYRDHLCWTGSLWGHAQEALFAGEQAVAMAPDRGDIRCSRGVARAITGDFPGAVDDFKAFVEWALRDEGYVADQIARRQAWIVELEAGRNPFDETTLQELRKEKVG
jgi:WD40 repeat protein